MTRTFTVEELRTELAIWRRDGIQLKQQLEDAIEDEKFANGPGRNPSLSPDTCSGRIYHALMGGPLQLTELLARTGVKRNTAHDLMRDMMAARQIVRVKFGVYGLPESATPTV